MNINFLQANGQYIGYSTITKACNLYNINIRTGCFCNPGACSLITTLSSSEQIKNYEQGHVCWDEKDLINGKPTGSVRISFGWSNTEKDLDLFLSMVEENLIMKHDTQKEFFLEKRILTLKQFIIYPIKSCSGISVPSWELSEEGPLFDREWTLVDSNGNYLSQKHYPKMSQIIPSIDLITRTLTISFANEKINLDLDFYPPDLFQDCTVCGTKVVGLVYKDSHITGMLSKFLNVTCHLVRKNPYNDRFARDCDKKINFSNDSQYLLVSQASLDDVNERMKHYDIDHSGCHYQHSDWLVDRFRPNFVIQGEMKPFEEDEFQVLHMGQKEFKITGNCNRCSMICVDQITLRVQNEPLKTLMKYRRRETKILFGVLLAHTNFKKGDRVSVGDVIIN
jgi:molybdenum cofactor sulfurtransferase